MALKGRLISVTSNRTLSVWKFSGVPNVTGREIHLHRIIGTRPTPENGRDGWSFDIGIYNFLKAAKVIRFSVAPPSIRTWYNLILTMVRETSCVSCPASAMILGQSEVSKLIYYKYFLFPKESISSPQTLENTSCNGVVD
jgi:hypothetical protein